MAISFVFTDPFRIKKNSFYFKKTQTKKLTVLPQAGTKENLRQYCHF